MKKKLLFTAIAGAALATALVVQATLPATRPRLESRAARVTMPDGKENPFATQRNLLTLGLAPSRMPADDAPVFYAYDITGVDGYSCGFAKYSLTDSDWGYIKEMSDTENELSFASCYNTATRGTWMGDDRLLVQSSNQNKYYFVSTETGEWLSSKDVEMSTNGAFSMTYNPQDQLVHGCFYDGADAICYGTFDPKDAEFTRTSVAPLTDSWSACAVAPDGTVYCVTNGYLSAYNPTTKNVAKVCDLPEIEDVEAHNLFFDYSDGSFYYVGIWLNYDTYSFSSTLYKMNLDTKAFTKVTDYFTAFVGPYVKSGDSEPEEGNPSEFYALIDDWNSVCYAKMSIDSNSYIAVLVEEDMEYAIQQVNTLSTYYGNGKVMVQDGVWNKKVYLLDSETGVIQKSYSIGSSEAVSWSYDYGSNNVYGCFKEGSNYMLGKLDTSKDSYAPQKIATCEKLCASAVAADGYIYAVKSNKDIVKIDKSTGTSTTLGNCGLDYPNSDIPVVMFYDWSSDVMYLIACVNESWATTYMWSVNLANCSVTKVNEWAFTCIYGVYKPYTPGGSDVAAPKSATDVTPLFEMGSLSGTVSFTAPTENVKGESGTGDLTYTVTANGEEVATASCSWGETVAAGVTLDEAGLYQFAVTVSNEGGNAASTNASEIWVGNDTPNAPDNVILKIRNGEVTLTWDAVATGVHGGYVNPSEIRYSVFDGAGTEVSSGLEACIWTGTLNIPENIETKTYSIRASYAGRVSDASVSNSAMLGHYTVPFSRNFNTKEIALKDFTLIDNTPGDPDYPTWVPKNWVWKDGAIFLDNSLDPDRDAWLISPQILLNGGVTYIFKIDAKTYHRVQKEVFAVYLLEGTNIANRLMTVIPVTSFVNGDEYEHYSVNITIPEGETGEYSFAVNCTTATKGGGLYIDNMLVKDASDYATPAKVSDLEVTPDPKGELKAAVRFTIPTLDINGDPIPYVEMYQVYRDNKVVLECSQNIEAGTPVEFTDDKIDAVGQYKYTVITSLKSRVSEGAEATVFVGVNAPGAVTELAVSEPAFDGNVTLLWKAPETDVNGDPLNSQTIKYNVYVYNRETKQLDVLAEGVEATSYTCQALETGKQMFMQWAVEPVTSGGRGTMCATDLTVTGTPYAAPYVESFADGTLSHDIALSVLKGSPQILMGDDKGTYSTIQSQDGDNGYVIAQGISAQQGAEDAVKLHMGRFLVPEKNPAFSFYYYPMNRYENVIQVNIKEEGGSENVLSFVSQEEEGWKRHYISLKGYEGKVVQIFVIMSVRSAYCQYVVADNFRMESIASNDLALDEFATPASMTAGDASEMTAVVSNMGFNTASNWKVSLLRDGEVVDSKEGSNLEPGGVKDLVFSQIPGIFWPETTVYSARVDFIDDENEENNESGDNEVKILMPSWPAVDDLRGTCSESTIKLEWTMPEGVENPEVTDGAENLLSWDTEECGDWTLVNRDGLVKLGYTNVTIPVAGSVCGFFVFDDSDAPAAFKAHSGNKYFAALSTNRGKNDVWLISPVLDGTKQTIDFWVANSFNLQTDYFEVLYSTTDRNPDSFVKLKEMGVTGAEWHNVEFELPEGALYFAIRSISENASMLKVDDLHFRSGVKSVADFQGYNLYRNGVLVNETLLTEPASVQDLPTSDEPHRYVVTVKYAKGESAPSNEVCVDKTSGVQAVASSAVAVNTGKGAIEVTGAEGRYVYVAAADGTVVFAGSGESLLRIQAESGVYVVKAGNRTFKVNVP